MLWAPFYFIVECTIGNCTEGTRFVVESVLEPPRCIIWVRAVRWYILDFGVVCFQFSVFRKLFSVIPKTFSVVSNAQNI